MVMLNLSRGLGTDSLVINPVVPFKGRRAIDVDEARAAIKTIMEGGENAFRLRREKYGF